MGMFDEIQCSYPLPGDVPAFAREPNHLFQTKDLDCALDNYMLAEDGRLLSLNGTEPESTDVTGEITFYTSNICGWGPGLYTRNGEDAESVEFTASFKDGRLVEIKQTDRKTEPALPSARQHATSPPALTTEQIAAIDTRQNESLVGREMYQLFGGTADGQLVKVIAESPRRLVVAQADGEFYIHYRSDRDRLLFDSEADARESRREDHSAWDLGKREYDEYSRDWYAKRGLTAPEASTP